MSLNAETLSDNVAALTVPGVTIRKLSKTPQAVQQRDCPIVYPVPEQFLVLEESRQLTLGPRPLWLRIYTLTYRYVHAAAGKDRTLADVLPGRVDGYARFIEAVSGAARGLGVKYVVPASTPELGVLQDASGAQFLAADILLRVTEFSAD